MCSYENKLSQTYILQWGTSFYNSIQKIMIKLFLTTFLCWVLCPKSSKSYVLQLLLDFGSILYLFIYLFRCTFRKFSIEPNRISQKTLTLTCIYCLQWNLYQRTFFIKRLLTKQLNRSREVWFLNHLSLSNNKTGHQVYIL